MVHVCSCAYKTSFLSCKVVQVIAETDEWWQGRRNVVCKSLPLFDCKTAPAISLLFRWSDMLGEAAASPHPFCPSSQHYRCVAWVQHRVGASDAGPRAPRHHRGAVTTCRLCPLRHTREQAETGILWRKKMTVYLSQAQSKAPPLWGFPSSYGLFYNAFILLLLWALPHFEPFFLGIAPQKQLPWISHTSPSSLLHIYFPAIPSSHLSGFTHESLFSSQK